MTKYTVDQIAAAKELQAAHEKATKTGLFDLLLDFTESPDSINDVCDALDQLVADAEV